MDFFSLMDKISLWLLLCFFIFWFYAKRVKDHRKWAIGFPVISSFVPTWSSSSFILCLRSRRTLACSSANIYFSICCCKILLTSSISITSTKQSSIWLLRSWFCLARSRWYFLLSSFFFVAQSSSSSIFHNFVSRSFKFLVFSSFLQWVSYTSFVRSFAFFFFPFISFSSLLFVSFSSSDCRESSSYCLVEVATSPSRSFSSATS